MFPFLTKDRMTYSKDVIETVELGPGKYLGQSDSNANRISPFNNVLNRNNHYNG